jgi:hypothetical protein
MFVHAESFASPECHKAKHQVFAPSEHRLPLWLPGTAPVAVSNALILVLADLRNDVWLMHLRE